MFRYLDPSGLERRLESVQALHDAIADRRVRDATPMWLEEEGRWSIASQNPAYREAKAFAGEPTPPAIAESLLPFLPPWVDWRIVRMAIVLVVLFLGWKFVSWELDAMNPDRHRTPVQVMFPDDPNQPPEDLDGRTRWVARQTIGSLNNRLGQIQGSYRISEPEPYGWLTGEYMVRASRHTRVGEYWDGAIQYYETYPDSVPIFLEQEMRRWAERAKLPSRVLEPMVRGAKRGWSPDLMLAQLEYARVARDLHGLLLRADGAVSASGVEACPDPTRGGRTNLAYMRAERAVRGRRLCGEFDGTGSGGEWVQFSSPDQQFEYDELADRLNAAADRVNALSAAAQENADDAMAEIQTEPETSKPSRGFVRAVLRAIARAL